MRTKKPLSTEKFSISLDPSVKQVIDGIAADENLKTGVMIRKLVVLGLKNYGIEVKGNQVVSA